MGSVPIPLGAYDRSGFPQLPQLNMLAERTPTNPEKGYALIQRPGLEDFATVGAGPIRGVFQKAGVFDGDAVVVSGVTVYRVTTAAVATALTGTVSGTGLVSMDGSSLAGVSTVRIANDAAIYKVDGSAVTAETFPDGAGVSSVAELDGFWFASRYDTQRIYVQLPGDTAWNALDYTSAEAEPDNIVGLVTLADELWGFGTDSLQVFALTGSASPAIRPIPGRRFDVGCKSRDTIVRVGEYLVWVGQQNIVHRASTVPEPISDSGLSEIISNAASGTLRAWTYSRDQHRMYVLRIGDTASWAFDDFTTLWTQFSSKALMYFRPHLGADVSGRALAADSDSAKLWLVSSDALDDAGDEIIRRAAGYLKHTGPPLACNRVIAVVDQGVGTATGQGIDPVLFLSISKDLGKIYDTQRPAPLGIAGATTEETIWRPGGTIRRPGWMFLLECSDPVRLRLTDLLLNEP